MTIKKHIYLIFAASLFVSNITMANEVQHNLRVDGITCPFCVATSAKALRKIDGVNKVDANLEEGIIKVCADASADFNDADLKKLFIDKGFNYRGKETLDNCDAG